MVFEHIEKLKREYTDKYVVVDVSQPELRRFEGQTGQVKTVNMNGNALVEFDAYDNIGWFDIGIDFLKVIDKPLPKEVQAEKKPTAKAVAKPAAKPAAEKKPGAGGKMSVAEMLAAARGEKGGETAAAAKPAAKEATATQPVAPAKAAAPTAKMSVAEMLAAARAEKSGGSATSPAQAAADEPKPAPEPASDPTPEPVAEQAPVIAAPAGDLPKDTAGILAYCRKVDG